MKYTLHTPLRGYVSLSDSLAESLPLRDLYRLIYVREGSLTLEIDRVETCLKKGGLISITPLHKITPVRSDSGEYVVLAFNSDFYCIYSHTDDISCSGVLFHGSSHSLRLELDDEQCARLNRIIAQMPEEFSEGDDLNEEMLRLQLKRLIITCTRIAREQIEAHTSSNRTDDLVRRYYLLVDQHFRTLHKVADYAALLHRSPKTLSNLFAEGGYPTPLRIIRERLLSEARRLLTRTPLRAKEIAADLGFEDTATFSRFFRTMTGESISSYRASHPYRKQCPNNTDGPESSDVLGSSIAHGSPDIHTTPDSSSGQ